MNFSSYAQFVENKEVLYLGYSLKNSKIKSSRSNQASLYS